MNCSEGRLVRALTLVVGQQLRIVTCLIPIKRSQTGRQLHSISSSIFVTTKFLDLSKAGSRFRFPSSYCSYVQAWHYAALGCDPYMYLLAPVLPIPDPEDKNMTQTRMNPLVCTCTYWLGKSLYYFIPDNQNGIGRLKPQLQRPDRYYHNHHHNFYPVPHLLACILVPLPRLDMIFVV